MQGAIAESSISIFTISPRFGSKDVAKASNLPQRCARITPSDEGKYMSPDGVRCTIERLPLCSCGGSKMWKYAVPVAVTLLLRFQLEATIIISLMFALTLPQMLNSIQRNKVRDACRGDLRVFRLEGAGGLEEGTGTGSGPQKKRTCDERKKMMGICRMPGDPWPPNPLGVPSTLPPNMYPPNDIYPPGTYRPSDTFPPGGTGPGGTGPPTGTVPPGGSAPATGSPSTVGRRRATQEEAVWVDEESFLAMRPECGYEHIALRRNIDQQPWWLWAAVGSCAEYSNSTNITLPPPGYFGPEIFTDTPSAHYCSSPSKNAAENNLASFGGLAIFLLWLLRLRRLQRVQEMARDRVVWSASDYTLQLELNRSLSVGSDAQALEAGIRQDLHALGIKDADLVAVEVASACSREQRVLNSLAAMRVRMEELHTQKAVASKQGSTRKMKLIEQIIKLMSEKMEKAREALRALETAPHETTGYVFITFQTQSARNELLTISRAGGHIWEAAARAISRRGHGRSPPVTRATPKLKAKLAMELKRLGQGSNLAARRVHTFGETDYLRGASVIVSPEPCSINWINLEVSTSKRACRKAVSYGVMACLIALNGAGIVLLKQEKNRISLEGASRDAYGLNESYGVSDTTVLSILTAVTTTATNFLLKMANRILTRAERHPTSHMHELSAFYKLSVALVMNTVLVPLIVHSNPYFVSQARLLHRAPTPTLPHSPDPSPSRTLPLPLPLPLTRARTSSPRRGSRATASSPTSPACSSPTPPSPSSARRRPPASSSASSSRRTRAPSCRSRRCGSPSRSTSPSCTPSPSRRSRSRSSTRRSGRPPTSPPRSPRSSSSAPRGARSRGGTAPRSSSRTSSCRGCASGARCCSSCASRSRRPSPYAPRRRRATSCSRRCASSAAPSSSSPTGSSRTIGCRGASSTVTSASRARRTACATRTSRRPRASASTCTSAPPSAPTGS